MANLGEVVHSGEMRVMGGSAMVSPDGLAVALWACWAGRGMLSLGKDGTDSDFVGILAT